MLGVILRSFRCCLCLTTLTTISGFSILIDVVSRSNPFLYQNISKSSAPMIITVDSPSHLYTSSDSEYVLRRLLVAGWFGNASPNV